MPKPPSTPESNRRRHPRVELFAQMQWKQGADVHILRVCNASLSGLLLEATQGELPAIASGTALELALFTDADPLDDAISLKAKLVRTEETGPTKMIRIGVEIVQFGPTSQARYTELLRQQSGK